MSGFAAYDAIADLLSYPSSEFIELMEGRVLAVSTEFPQAEDLLRTFKDEVLGMNVEELEELYTKTFDNNTQRCLEVGWHLFGENYSRGAFLVYLRSELRRLSIPESAELPDHLTHVLRVTGRLDPEFAASFVTDSVCPAIEIIEKNLAGDSNIYIHLVRAALLICRTLADSAKASAVQEAIDG